MSRAPRSEPSPCAWRTCPREAGVALIEMVLDRKGAFEAVRQGQQNRRGRGRNRKSQNPLSRSFESNGPDVKIRGTPAHIAEKYLTLSRDAQSSGDPVLAENYLQHAEHYSRIIMAYREQLNQPGDGMNGNGQRIPGRSATWAMISATTKATRCWTTCLQQAQPQARQHHQPRQHSGYNANRNDRPFRRDQGRYRDRNDRDRNGGDRNSGDRDRPPVEGRAPQQDRPPSRTVRPSRIASTSRHPRVGSIAGETGSSSRMSSRISCAAPCGAPAAKPMRRRRRARTRRRAISRAPLGPTLLPAATQGARTLERRLTSPPSATLA